MRQLMVVAVAAVAAGCDFDCDNPARLDGDYAVYSYVTSEVDFTGPTDDEVQTRILRELFANGWSEWSLKYVPSKGNFQVTLGGDQVYAAEFAQDEANCNQFTLVFTGTWVSPSDTTHAFKWTGDLTYMGAHITGTFTYKGQFVDPDGSGEISIPAGEVRATLMQAGDTGF